MKKAICGLMILLGIYGFSTPSWALCGLYACGGNDSINASYEEDSDQCYYCNDSFAGNKECEDGDIVGQVDKDGYVRKLYQCTTGFWNDKWRSYDPSTVCVGSHIHPKDIKQNAAHAQRSIALDDRSNATRRISVGEDVVLRAGHTGCIFYKCDSGYIPNRDRTACIEDERPKNCKESEGDWNGYRCECSRDYLQTSSDGLTCEYKEGVKDCLNSGGTWANNKCTCTADKHLKLEKGRCVCTPSDYTYNSQTKQCELGDAARQQRAVNTEAAKKRACENSGGTYYDSVGCSCSEYDGLRLSGNKCVCKDADHVWHAASRTCKLTDVAALKEACLKASDTKWDNQAKKCICLDDPEEKKRIWRVLLFL
ncbi:hypothetical protein HDR63_04420 [bacterium]|nr:hypothetical protein [bacterium]